MALVVRAVETEVAQCGEQIEPGDTDGDREGGPAQQMEHDEHGQQDGHADARVTRC